MNHGLQSEKATTGTKRRWLALERFVVSRFLGSRARSYVSLVSSISMWGLAVGVASLVVIFSVSAGFEEVFREKILGLYPHLIVIGKGGDLSNWRSVRQDLKGQKGLESVSPTTYDEMMCSHGTHRGEILLKGIDIASPQVRESLSPFVQTGDLASLDDEPLLRLNDGHLVLENVVGGSTWVVVLPSMGPPYSVPVYLEESLPSGMQLVSALDDSVRIRVESFLEDLDFRLVSGDSSAFIESPPEATSLEIDGVEHRMSFSQERLAVLLAPGSGDGLDLLSCPLPPPGGATAQPWVCVANLTDQPVTLEGTANDATALPGVPLLAQLSQHRLPGVFLGVQLAKRLDVAPGDEVTLVSPFYSLGATGSNGRHSLSIADSFVFQGTLKLGFHEYDNKLAIISFDTARQFLHQGPTARWLEIRVDDLFLAEERRLDVLRQLSGVSVLNLAAFLPLHRERLEIVTSMQPVPQSPLDVLSNAADFIERTRYTNPLGELGWGIRDSYRVIGWEEMNRPLFSSMKTQRLVLSLFFLIIILVAAFNVVSSQVMIVNEKSGDIAILKAMGATDDQIRRIFLLQGLRLGITGLLTGLILAGFLVAFLHLVGFPLDPEVYFVSFVPVHVNVLDVVLACIISMLAIYLSVSVAARRAAGRSPVDGLRELE